MNVMNGFNQVISEFVDVHILQTLVNFLNKDKGCSVSLDELRTALQLTVVTPAPSPMRAPMAGVQPPLLSNFVPTAVHSGRGTKKDKVPPGARLCQYQFGKGKNVGKTCGEVYGELAVEGSDRCKNCIDKGSGKKDKTKDAPSSSSSADGSKAPAIPHLANPTTPPDQGELQVYPCKDQPGVFKTLQHGFIVKQIDQHHIVATGIEDAATGKARPLTDAEKKIAYDLGIAVVDSDTPRAASTTPAHPAPPVPPTAPVAQAMVGPTSVPSVPGVPTIPVFPPSAGTGTKPVANVTIPSFPNLNVPTLPKAQVPGPSQPVAGLVIPKM
jgi:hypothetical protein